MLKTRGQRFALITMLAMIGLVTFTLHAGVGLTVSDDSPSQIRMSVDPTILPPIGPDTEDAVGQDGALAPTDGAAAPAASEKPAVAGQPQATSAPASKPAPQPAPTQTSKPAPAPASKPAPAPAPAPKPAPQPARKPGAKGTITAIALQPSKAGFTLTISCDRPVGETTYLNLSDPARLVVDMAGSWSLKAANVVRAASGKVKHVVVGEHADKTRFVIHFNVPVRGKLTPEFKRSGNTLAISVALP